MAEEYEDEQMRLEVERASTAMYEAQERLAAAQAALAEKAKRRKIEREMRIPVAATPSSDEVVLRQRPGLPLLQQQQPLQPPKQPPQPPPQNTSSKAVGGAAAIGAQPEAKPAGHAKKLAQHSKTPPLTKVPPTPSATQAALSGATPMDQDWAEFIVKQTKATLKFDHPSRFSTWQ
jgi:hypothetical protein